MWGYCENCGKLYPRAKLTSFTYYDPNKKILDPNDQIIILICDTCKAENE